MLKIHINSKEYWDESEQRFGKTKEYDICLEHSLVSISKWESKYKKPYLHTDEKSNEEILYYIKCMTISQNVDDYIYGLLSKEDYKKINDYISDTMSATWFNENKGNENKAYPAKKNNEQITSELVYYWMFSYRIPITCEKWHLNRLLNLIRIFSIKDAEANGKSNKMSKRDILSQNRALNAARRKQLNTAG